MCILILLFAERKNHCTLDLRRKIALFCNVKQEAVIEAADAPTIYEVPLLMMREKLDLICLKKLNITNYNEPDTYQMERISG